MMNLSQTKNGQSQPLKPLCQTWPAEREQNQKKEVENGFAEVADQKEKDNLNALGLEAEKKFGDQNEFTIEKSTNMTISLKTDVADRKKKIFTTSPNLMTP